MTGTNLMILYLTLSIIVVIISMIMNLSAYENNMKSKQKGESRLE